MIIMKKYNNPYNGKMNSIPKFNIEIGKIPKFNIEIGQKSYEIFCIEMFF